MFGAGVAGVIEKISDVGTTFKVVGKMWFHISGPVPGRAIPV